MPITVSGLARHAPFGLLLLSDTERTTAPIAWAYSSDLADPTPFLSGGELLLTTGTQFPSDLARDEFDAYVSRLDLRGVVALGFGTEVFRAGIPPELRAACARIGFPLLEVPYGTPFLAIIRWIADIVARDARAHDEWSFSAQRAISVAALRGGLSDVLDTLAARLSCRVALFGADLALHGSSAPFSASELDLLRAEARRLLGGTSRSSGSVALSSGLAVLQTVGHPGRLRGVIVTVGGVAQDMATRAVITSAVALAEVTLEQQPSGAGSSIGVHSEALALILAGHADAMARAIVSLPRTAGRVALIATAGSALEDALARRTQHLPHGLFVARHQDRLLVIAFPADWPEIVGVLDSCSASAGVSDIRTLDDLAGGLARAHEALEANRSRDGAWRPGIVEFSSLPDLTLTSLVGPDAAARAASRLAPVLDATGGEDDLRAAAVWLSHNGQWDPAAQQLGIHRHSLKKRMERLGDALGLRLERFPDRAELWLLLTAVHRDRSA